MISSIYRNTSRGTTTSANWNTNRRACLHDHIEADQGMVRDLQGGVRSEKAILSLLWARFGVVERIYEVNLSPSYGD